jgi:serine/threonine protein kinase
MSEDKPKSPNDAAKTLTGIKSPVNEGSGANKRPEPHIVPRADLQQRGPADATVVASGTGRQNVPAQAGQAAQGTMANGTPMPGQPVVAASSAATQIAQQQPRKKAPSSSTSAGAAGTGRDETSGLLPLSSTWDKHVTEDGTTGVHQAQPHPGVRINQYEMIKMIGEGGMGTVYLARDLRLGRRVAIKFLQSNQSELTQRFLVEARATARCQHDNIVVIYEVGEQAGAPYMVLEFLNGQPLTHYIKGGQKLPYTRTIEIMTSVLRALDCAHQQGIVHRDLKPDNIFVLDSGTIKVLDFGIAKVLEAQQSPAVASSGQLRMPSPLELATGTNASLTRHGTIMGTLKYMSPEQWGIGIEIDHLSDIWACGIMLHRMICGRHPLHPLDGNQLVVTAMLELPMPSMTEAAPPDVPRELIQIVDRCLLKNKEQRWQSAAELLKAIEPFLPGRRTVELRIDESPYAGLSSFQESDAGKFFGRNKEIAAMVTRIRDQPLMAVVGSSGVGKSSFLRAGLVPALKRSGEQWETLVVRPGRSPLEALASITAPMVATAANLADEMDEQKKLVEKLRHEPGHLGHLLRGRARRDNRRVLLFVDQFEELYTLVPDPAERAAFTACLAAVADDATSPLRVVLSIRSDFLDRVAEDQQFVNELTQGLFFLGPPNREGLRDAIVQPAEMAGFRFEIMATVEDMLDHLETTPGALPLLQFAAARLWENRDTARRMLTNQSYAAMGGVAGALASHADHVIHEIGPHKQGLVRALLLRLVTPERTRAIVPMNELRELSREVGEVQQLVNQLVDARLLVVQNLEGGKGSTAEIVHESLINSWPTLRRWLDENQDDAALVDQLRTAARQWAAKNRSSDLLWRGESADEAKKFKKRYKGPLSDVERAFLDEIISYETAAARRRRVMIVGGFIGLGGLVVAAMIAAFMIKKNSDEAAKQASIAAKESQKTEEALKLQVEEAQKAYAEERKRKEVEKQKEVVDVKLGVAEKDLIEERDKLKDALKLSQEAEAREKVQAQIARNNQLLAESSEAQAKKSEQEAVKAKVELQKNLDAEKARVQRLEKERGSIVETLP